MPVAAARLQRKKEASLFRSPHSSVIPRLRNNLVEEFSTKSELACFNWKRILVNRIFCRMRFLPVFFDLSRRSVVLIGSGAPAIAKLRLLRAAGANVRWFAQGADAGNDLVHARHYAGHIEVIAREPDANDLAGALAIVSSAGKEVDERVASLGGELNIPLNIVDRPDLSTFIFPAVVDRGEVVVAISTGGASPVLARRLREKIEAILPARIGEFAAWMRTYREHLGELRARGVSIRRFWEKVIDGPIGAAFFSGRTEKATTALLRAIPRCLRIGGPRRRASCRRRPGRRGFAHSARAADAAGGRRDFLRRVDWPRHSRPRAPRRETGFRRQAQGRARHRTGRDQPSSA